MIGKYIHLAAGLLVVTNRSRLAATGSRTRWPLDSRVFPATPP